MIKYPVKRRLLPTLFSFQLIVQEKMETLRKSISGGNHTVAVSHRGAISFGMVHIPVGLYTATQDVDIHFNQLCKEDGSRVKYKKVCANCGKEVSAKDIVKGFEYEKGKYVTLTDDDFEQAKTEKDKTIHILHFTNLSNIRPVYYDKTYHAIPEQGGEKAYELLRKAMKEENKIAIAKTVLGTKEKLLALIPTDDDIMVETMYFADEVKEAPKEIPQPEVSEQELHMAKLLIGSMEQEFNPAAYKDEYRQRLWEIINAKIQGKEIIAAPEEGQSNVINLMDALKASLEKQKQTVQPKKSRNRKKAASE